MPIDDSAAAMSVVIPCYNESATLAACVAAVLATENDAATLQIIIVDDGSTDGSGEIATGLASQNDNVELHSHSINRGKGASLRTGFQFAKGVVVAIQDADLEYDPGELRRLAEPIFAGDADVVFGSRFSGCPNDLGTFRWHRWGNRGLTLLSNLMTGLTLSDMETCYKLFRRDVISEIEIEENRFGFEPEIVAKIANRKLRVREMPIGYRGRSYAQGKKIGFRDGLRALYCIVYYNRQRRWRIAALATICIAVIAVATAALATIA